MMWGKQVNKNLNDAHSKFTSLISLAKFNLYADSEIVVKSKLTFFQNIKGIGPGASQLIHLLKHAIG